MSDYLNEDCNIVPTNVKYSSYLLEDICIKLKAKYPFIDVGEIGKSVLGRPIFYIKIGQGKSSVFYSGAFHANEWITTPLLLKFVEMYAKAYSTESCLYGYSAKRLFCDYQLYVVPMVNPDGVDLVNSYINEEKLSLRAKKYYKRALKIASCYKDIPFPDGWKANIEGIDLNLQFRAGWLRAKKNKVSHGVRNAAPRDFVGAAPLIAPESRAVYNFTCKHDFLLILAYHSQGEVIYHKYLNYNPAGSQDIAEYFKSVSGYEVLNTPAESGYAGYKDWFIKQYNRPGYTIEVGNGVSPLPLSQFDDIYEKNKLILLGGMVKLNPQSC